MTNQKIKTMSKIFFVSLLIFGFFEIVVGGGAGKAFPMKSAKYILKKFQEINPDIIWDPRNYLTDLAGLYASCDFDAGVFEVAEKNNKEAYSIAAVVEYTTGTGYDVDHVNADLKPIIDHWIASGKYNVQIKAAKKFGCSVNPGCDEVDDSLAISCLFGPGFPTIQPIISTTPEPDVEPNDQIGGQLALAFTKEQYLIAELITKQKWDRSHFLENLSGFETDCAMIGSSDWPFSKARNMVSGLGLRVVGTYGYAENKGSTPEALEKILRDMKPISRVKQAGCSIIPDCIVDRKMQVVISCLYEE